MAPWPFNVKIAGSGREMAGGALPAQHEAGQGFTGG